MALPRVPWCRRPGSAGIRGGNRGRHHWRKVFQCELTHTASLPESYSSVRSAVKGCREIDFNIFHDALGTTAPLGTRPARLSSKNRGWGGAALDWWAEWGGSGAGPGRRPPGRRPRHTGRRPRGRRSRGRRPRHPGGGHPAPRAAATGIGAYVLAVPSVRVAPRWTWRERAATIEAWSQHRGQAKGPGFQRQLPAPPRPGWRREGSRRRRWSRRPE